MSEGNNINSKNKKKFDLKNVSKEDKVKYLGIAGILIVGGSIMGYGYFSNQEENTDTIEAMSNPEAELSKYNSKLDALNGKKDPNLANDLERTFAEEKKQEDGEVNYDELDRQIANLGKSHPNQPQQNQQPTSQSVSNSGGGGYSGGGSSRGGASNSHNVYGNYDMWQTNEPANSRIEYSNKNNRPAPKQSRPQQQYKSDNIEYVEAKQSATYQPAQPQVRTSYSQEVVLEPRQVKAKLISQGYATSGRSLSFILLEPTTIAGQSVKKGQVITGVAKEQDNRLNVNFSSIKIDNKVYNASMELIGSDGMKGLPISQQEDSGNGAVENEVRNQAGNVVSRVPIIGGIVSSATRGGNRSNSNQSVKLTSNITCYILIY